MSRTTQRMLQTTVWMALGISGAVARDAGVPRSNLSEAWQLCERGQYVEAERIYRSGLERMEATSGVDGAEMAAVLTGMGRLSATMGKYADAERLQRRALSLIEKSAEPNPALCAAILSNLAAACLHQNRHAEAEPLFLRALSIGEQAAVRDARATVGILNNLAVLYPAQSRLREAEEFYRRSLDLAEKELGPQHPETATLLNNLARLYAQRSRFLRAEPLYRRAMAIQERTWGGSVRQARRALQGRDPAVEIAANLGAGSGPAGPERSHGAARFGAALPGTAQERQGPAAAGARPGHPREHALRH